MALNVIISYEMQKNQTCLCLSETFCSGVFAVAEAKCKIMQPWRGWVKLPYILKEELLISSFEALV